MWIWFDRRNADVASPPRMLSLAGGSALTRASSRDRFDAHRFAHGAADRRELQLMSMRGVGLAWIAGVFVAGFQVHQPGAALV